MLNSLKTPSLRTKCRFSYGGLPGYIDRANPPQEKLPCSDIVAQRWYHDATLILPSIMLPTVRDELKRFDTLPGRPYAKVILSLLDILTGDFFNIYIKKGNISMLSEGRPGVDNLMWIHEGNLHIELDKATYERAGLIGKPVNENARKHKHNRYAIDLNLRRHSMLHGGKGFERIIWAARKVLNSSMTWLFFDNMASSTSSSGNAAPIEKHHPRWLSSNFLEYNLGVQQVPDFLLPSRSYDGISTFQVPSDKYASADLLEYFDLLNVASPLVTANNKVDPFLGRYAIPMRSDYETDALEDRTRPLKASDHPDSHDFSHFEMCKLQWTGFLPSSTVLSIFIASWRATQQYVHGNVQPLSTWVTFSVSGFEGQRITICANSKSHIPNRSSVSYKQSQQSEAEHGETKDGMSKREIYATGGEFLEWFMQSP